MKYNILASYRGYLSARGLADSSAMTYYNAMSYLLADQLLLDCRKMNVGLILSKLEAMRYKNEYSKHKNAFLKFCDFVSIPLDHEIRVKLDTMQTQKKKKYRKLKPIKLLDIKNHLRVIRDKKLELSFNTLLYTGLRVSELSQIEKDDCIIANDSIELSFIGKGGAKEKVTINESDHKNYFNSLLDLIEGTKPSEKVFYSASYLQSKATEKGFSCHDLRRAYAKVSYRDNKDMNATRQLLRHSNLRNTKIYLRSKVQI